MLFWIARSWRVMVQRAGKPTELCGTARAELDGYRRAELHAAWLAELDATQHAELLARSSL